MKLRIGRPTVNGQKSNTLKPFTTVEVVEAVADTGIYVHDGYVPRKGFKNMHFLPWSLIEAMKGEPAPTKEAIK